MVQGLAQRLAQDLFLRTFQAMNPLTGAEQATTSPDSASGFTGTLLAALTAPPATAAAATAPDTTATLATTQATALPATAALAVPELTTATQAVLPDSSSVDFALQTALRFGAGVAPGAAPALQLPGAGAGPIRDATAVARQEHLLLQTGRSGAEILAQPQTALPQAVNAYRTAAVAEPPAGLDLLA
jgi:hypothetical protein